jgi:hypothetical protein
LDLIKDQQLTQINLKVNNIAIDSNYSNLTFFKQLLFAKKENPQDPILAIEMRGILDENYLPIEIDWFKVNLLPMKIATEFSMLKVFDFIL